MRFCNQFRVAAFVLASVFFAPAYADKSSVNTETLVERSQKRANAVLDRAVEALGGADALNSIQAVRITTDAEYRSRLQMPTPKPPFEAGSERAVLLFDIGNNRLRVDEVRQYSGNNYKTSVVIRDGEGLDYDHLARTVTPMTAAQTSQQGLGRYHRRLPNLILRQALARLNSVRYLGEERVDGRMHDVITFVMADAQQIALYVDRKTALISKYDFTITDAVAGMDVNEVRFSEYVRVGKLNIPQRWSFRVAGEEGSSFKAKVEINPTLDAKSFELEDIAGYVRVASEPSSTTPFVETLADGVYVLHHFARTYLNVLVVVFNDHVLTVDAPGNSAGTEAIIAKIKELAPGKPLRYLALSHHHAEHIGGLRSFIAEGAEIVTTPGNVGLVKEMAKASHKDRLARAPRPLKISLIENSKRIFDDGTQRVELLDIGPNPHAREMVIAWLPKQKIIFQGDLFFMTYDKEPLVPPQPSNLAFARVLDERKLDAERIAGAHGRTATRKEFNDAMGLTKQ